MISILQKIFSNLHWHWQGLDKPARLSICQTPKNQQILRRQCCLTGSPIGQLKWWNFLLIISKVAIYPPYVVGYSVTSFTGCYLGCFIGRNIKSVWLLTFRSWMLGPWVVWYCCQTHSWEIITSKIKKIGGSRWMEVVNVNVNVWLHCNSWGIELRWTLAWLAYWLIALLCLLYLSVDK